MGIGMKLMKSFVGKPQQITTMTDPDIFFLYFVITSVLWV
jgi:hypothetical protein